MTNRDVIVIGGSSGASDALKRIVPELPADLPAALFVVTHMPAHGIGILATVLAAAGVLPVRPAQDGEPVEAGCIYVARPDHHLLLAEGRVVLGRGPRENMARPAIDPLFRSAAACCGPRVIGVLLSGFLNDGVSGLGAIKDCGGIAVVQHPDDAAADEMPMAALRAVAVDHCRPAAELGALLATLAREPAGQPVPVPPEIRLEVEIAAGGRADTDRLRRLADPSTLTCPSCGGTLSEVRDGQPLRFRCQVGHAYTAETLDKEQESAVDEAMRVALRVIEERSVLVARMAEDARATGRPAVAALYESRAAEYRGYADTIRRALLTSLPPAGEVEGVG